MLRSINDIKNKRVLYVATKNADYLRLTQELRILRSNGNKVTEIVSPSKSYPKRLLYVYKKLLGTKTDDLDVIFVGFAPQLVLPLFPRKLKKKPLVIDFFISMYDTLCFDRRKFKPHSLIGRLIKRIDTKTIRKADLCICDTNAHGMYFCEEFGYPQEKMSTLYLEADTSIYYPREKQGSNDRFTVLYFGSVLPLQGVDVILDAIGRLENEKDLHFIFVGPLGDHVRKGEKITEYINWLPQDKLAEKIAQADLCLGGHFNDSIMKAKRTIAGKTYIYRAMKKPMILGENAANHELFSSGDKDVYFVKMGDSAALAELILKIRDSKK